MTSFNLLLFQAINAPTNGNAIVTAFAIFFAEYAIWLLPLGLALAWLRGNEPLRRSVVEAIVGAALALVLAEAIRMAWYHPRPFAMGIGHKLVEHAADSSFPSEHLTLLAAVALCLCLRPASRGFGAVLLALVPFVAWARICVGVHFPLDMLGAAVVASVSSLAIVYGASTRLEPAHAACMSVHATVLRPLIRRGWVRR